MSLQPSALRAGQLVRRAMSLLQTDHELAVRCLSEAVQLLDSEGDGNASSRQAEARGGCGLARWQARRVIAHIDANLGARLRISELASLLPLSTTHFSRGFHRTMGCSPTAYIAAKRVERAKSLLQTTAEPMCAIALTCGFADQAHFSKTFRRLAGVTPSVWRRAHATDPACHTQTPMTHHQPLIRGQLATIS